MGRTKSNGIQHGDGRLIAGCLGAVLLTIPIIIRLAYGDGNAWDWMFLVIGVGLAAYWVVLALRGRRARRHERVDLRDQASSERPVRQ
ncbi:hypothetical protein [Arthrobacter antioxidans]|uniref:hypothetical protein n=1 Tax=Arthrobacter antioxidans TaxID=2895818 RepID=UPI001FFE74D5|nr:hypothetical protein [Arthrobacter antioxidans]